MTIDETIAEIVSILYDARAMDWTIQDKAAFLAAINLQLQEQDEETQEE